ncbi:MAG: phospholipase A2 [Alteromonas naphthalenivorans]|jgi:phospholipase A2
MKKSIVMGILCFSMITLHGKLTSGSSFVDTVQGFTHSTFTTKLHSVLSQFRKGYCLVKPCRKIRKKLFDNFPLTTDLIVKTQVKKNNKTVARLRSSASLCDQEVQFQKKRLVHVQKSLGQVFGKKVADALGEKAPTIAICASGGGYRAMIGTLGMYEGFTDNKFIDCVTYASCLSGSTWFTFPRALGAPVEAIKDGYKRYAGSLSKLSKKKFKYAPHESQLVNDNITRSFLFNVPISLPTIYGARVAHTVFAAFDDLEIRKKYPKDTNFPFQSRQQMLISQTKNYIEQSNCSTFPMPIGTMVSPLSSSKAKAQKTKLTPYLWAEVTPYEIGFDYYDKKTLTGAYVPTWASGRTFIGKGGSSFKKHTYFESKNFAPELEAGTFMGIFGSAFNASAADGMRMFFDFQKNASGVKGLAAKIYSFVVLGSAPFKVFLPGKNTRVFPAELPNYAVKPNPVIPANQSYWTVADAGLAGNLPFLPLLKKDRNVDIIIAFDLSNNIIEGSDALVKAEELANNRNIPFPIIKKSPKYQQRKSQWVTVFDEYSKGQQGPIIINLSLLDYPKGKGPKGFSLKECFKGECKTANFDYSPKNVDGLSALGKAIAQSAIPAIEKALLTIAKRS